MALETSMVKKYYDRFGAKQNSQGFYEDPAIDRMVEHAGFESAETLFELGCGTGKLAHRLLREYLPGNAVYTGLDVSDTMVRLAAERLAEFGRRAVVMQSAGGAHIPLEDKSVDRVVCAYVLDLLPEIEIARVFSEVRRVLKPGGRFCCVSLGRGTTLGSKVVGGLWAAVYRAAPMLVGGCRPISLSKFMDPGAWSLLCQEVVAPYWIPSEVLVAEPRNT